MNKYVMKFGETLNKDLEELPIGELVEIQDATLPSKPTIPVFRAVRVSTLKGMSYISVPTKSYHLVQHKDAFRPIIEGITQSGVQNFNYVLYSTPKKANLQVYIDGETMDSVRLGFNISNSLDGHNCLSYGIKLDNVNRHIELVGYRQICSNGMKIRVPLDQAEIIKPEVVAKIKNLLSEQVRLRHTKSITEKMKIVQYIAEAISLLRQPVENMIKQAKNFVPTEAQLKQLIKGHVGKRYQKKVLRQYNALEGEEANVWGLYNALTYVASHDEDISDVSRETLKDKAATLLVAASSIPTAEVV